MQPTKIASILIGNSEDQMGAPDQAFREIFDQAAIGIAQISLDGTWLHVNSRYCEMLGYTETELLAKKLHDINPPNECAEILSGRNQMLAGVISTHSMEKQYIRKDGTIFWGRLHRSLVRDENNLPQYFIAVVEDITEKIEAERALKESEQRLRLAMSTGVGLWEYDLRGGTPELSPVYGQTFGRSPRDHKEWFELVHPDDRPHVMALIRESIEKATEWSTEFRVVRPDGGSRWLLSKGSVLIGDDGRPSRMVGVSLDITTRKQAEDALQESEQRFRAMADTAPVMIWVTAADKRATFFNKACLDFTGQTLEEKLGDGWIGGLHPDDRDPFLNTYASSTDARVEFHSIFRLRRADGEYRWVLCTGVPRFGTDRVFVGFIGSCIDITDIKKAEEEALSRQKLESLGVLANGIAHDFNNILGGILASAETALAESDERLAVEEELLRIRSASIRGAEIVRQLMIYGGNESPTLELTDISALVGELAGLLQVSISKHTIFSTELGRGLRPVRASAAQIQQTVMNLVLNASEAIGEREGAIRISTSQLTIPASESLDWAVDLPKGDYVRLEISDTGSGMTPEIRARIFDPFYTTKGMGRGLGLAAVRGIVRAHGGILKVSSTPGQGSRFEILLPCSDESIRDRSDGELALTSRASESVIGTVLVIEDEEILRLAVTKMLKRLGLEVIEAGDGTSGFSLFQTNASKVDVILLDVTIPGMASGEILEAVRHVQPQVKVILTSAFSENQVSSSIRHGRPWGYIRKPYRFSDLTALLHRACFELTDETGKVIGEGNS